MSSLPTRRQPFAATPVTGAGLLIAAALATWIVTVLRMRGMDAGPGTDLGGLGWYLGVWVTMMAAMMLPSAAPMVLLFQRISGERHRRGQSFVPTWVFILSYLAVWTGYGLAAYGLYRLVIHFGSGFLAWTRAGPYVAGGAIVLAGLYELTALKSVCLRHCRGPFQFILGGWREGWTGAMRMGAEHGAYCVGCCWGLMIVLFALGVMSILWMVVVAALIFAQKVLPRGDRLTRVFAVGFVAAGVWIAAAPASVPGLTQPNSAAAREARMRMMSPAGGAGMTSGAGMSAIGSSVAGGCSTGNVVTTASYLMALQIGPMARMYTPAEASAKHPKSGELMLGGTMGSTPMTMGSTTRHLELHVCSRRGVVVTGAHPTITLTAAGAKASTSLPVAAMEAIGAGKADYHYGNNVQLAAGRVTVVVTLEGQRAVFHTEVGSSAMPMSG